MLQRNCGANISPTVLLVRCSFETTENLNFPNFDRSPSEVRNRKTEKTACKVHPMPDNDQNRRGAVNAAEGRQQGGGNKRGSIVNQSKVEALLDIDLWYV